MANYQLLNLYLRQKLHCIFHQRSSNQCCAIRYKKCYFTIGINVFKQTVGNPIGIDPDLFRSSLFVNLLSLKMSNGIFHRNPQELADS